MLTRSPRAWLLALGLALAGCAGGDPADAASPGGSTLVETSEADASRASPGTVAGASGATPIVVAAAPSASGTPSLTSNPLLTRTVRILCVGDSMTSGTEEASFGFRSYRGRLYQRLIGAGYQVDFVGTQQRIPAIGGDGDHDGYGGAWIGPGGSPNNLWDRMAGILASTDPDVVIMALGWNSAYGERQIAGQKYRDLVNRVRALKPNAHIVVATLSPQRGQSEAQTGVDESGFAAINAVARAMAGESPTDRIHLADYAAAGFVASDYWDVIHWTQSGGDRAADVIYRALVSGPLKRP